MAKSYYKTINGVRYDRALLEAAEERISGQVDGSISEKAAEEIVELTKDGGRITETELTTLKYIRENYKLMQLYAPSISIQQKQHINEIFENFKPLLNKTGVRKMMVQDGIGEISLIDLFQNFKRNISDHNAKK